MSIVSTLALLITAATAKVRKIKPNPSNRLFAEIAALQARVDNLNRQSDDLIADLTRQCDEWQRLAMDYQDRLYGDTAQQMAQVQLAQQLQNAHNAHAHNMRQLYQQNPQHNAFVCNCTPGRSQVWAEEAQRALAEIKA